MRWGRKLILRLLLLPSSVAPSLVPDAPAVPGGAVVALPFIAPPLQKPHMESLLWKDQNLARAQWSKSSANEVKVTRSIPLWAN